MMRCNHELEEKIKIEVRRFVHSIYSHGQVMADISALVEVTSLLPLTHLDYWERLIRGELSLAHNANNPSRWQLWSKPEKTAQFVSWLDLISWDGYRREKTLRALTGSAPNSFFCALAFRRLNDWVPQVREAAREKLPAIVSASDPVSVVDALCITFSNWNTWGRIQKLEKQVLLDLISLERVTEALKSKIVSATSGPINSVFAQVGRSSSIDPYLGEIALHAIISSVRARAFRSLFEGRIMWQEGLSWEWTDKRYCKGRLRPVVAERKLAVSVSFLDALRKASVDRSSKVRRVAAEFLIREFDNLGNEALVLAQYFANDKSAAVSERGRFTLKNVAESN